MFFNSTSNNITLSSVTEDGVNAIAVVEVGREFQNKKFFSIKNSSDNVLATLNMNDRGQLKCCLGRFLECHSSGFKESIQLTDDLSHRDSDSFLVRYIVFALNIQAISRFFDAQPDTNNPKHPTCNFSVFKTSVFYVISQWRISFHLHAFFECIYIGCVRLIIHVQIDQNSAKCSALIFPHRNKFCKLLMKIHDFLNI
ncbi:hypothetical protein PIROE2DRAFT_19758 [Piromyces sp. E2]|nr:hypothetical protein PIROE2DRAFT_19758 [Piromyces sp. E2]|eukprot:OUM69029.1 hypothetical protein PIROE2DRAFT_19758 [Piromyces sp. E2]